MIDIFFSYKSDDRERVRPVRDAFAALGFDVFWDQQVPAGVDWDSWIRRHLAESKCAIVFWSSASAASDNVRHEATVAKQQGKLVAALLEPLTAAQFPMGMYSQQAANLVDWRGDLNDAAWGNLRREVESKLVPRWMQQRLDELEAELIAERARREGTESRNKVLRAQIAKEAQGDEDLRHERDKAIDEVTSLRATVQQLNRALSEAEARTAQESQRANEADFRRQTVEQQPAFIRAAEPEARVSDPGKLSLARRPIHNLAIISAIILIALMVTGTSYVLWQRQPVTAPSLTGVSGPGVPPRGPSEPPSGGVATPAAPKGVATPGPPKEVATPAPPKAAATPVPPKEVATPVPPKEVATPAPPNGVPTPAAPKESPPPAASGATLAQAADQRAQPSRSAESAAASIAFTITQGMEANGKLIDLYNVPSIADCQDRCAKNSACNVYSYTKIYRTCYSNGTATLGRNKNNDTGIRNKTN